MHLVHVCSNTSLKVFHVKWVSNEPKTHTSLHESFWTRMQVPHTHYFMSPKQTGVEHMCCSCQLTDDDQWNKNGATLLRSIRSQTNLPSWCTTQEQAVSGGWDRTATWSFTWSAVLTTTWSSSLNLYQISHQRLIAGQSRSNLGHRDCKTMNLPACQVGGCTGAHKRWIFVDSLLST